MNKSNFWLNISQTRSVPDIHPLIYPNFLTFLLSAGIWYIQSKRASCLILMLITKVRHPIQKHLEQHKYIILWVFEIVLSLRIEINKDTENLTWQVTTAALRQHTQIFRGSPPQHLLRVHSVEEITDVTSLFLPDKWRANRDIYIGLYHSSLQ